MLQILGNLDFKSLVRCSQLNKRFNAITRDTKLYTSLNLKPYWNCIDDTTLRFLEERCNGLKRIDLSWTNNTNISSQTFIRFLRKCCGGLTHLRLNACDFVTRDVIKEISKICSHLKGITKFVPETFCKTKTFFLRFLIIAVIQNCAFGAVIISKHTRSGFSKT